mmetsp:Transcript_51457/g.166864  ORF Transcript_51457/g.166864 Transcript_51457/m.166864 type:complete len:267 (-) Transcript_51457:742-1542(-)
MRPTRPTPDKVDRDSHHTCNNDGRGHPTCHSSWPIVSAGATTNRLGVSQGHRRGGLPLACGKTARRRLFQVHLLVVGAGAAGPPPSRQRHRHVLRLEERSTLCPVGPRPAGHPPHKGHGRGVVAEAERLQVSPRRPRVRQRLELRPAAQCLRGRLDLGGADDLHVVPSDESQAGGNVEKTRDRIERQPFQRRHVHTHHRARLQQALVVHMQQHTGSSLALQAVARSCEVHRMAVNVGHLGVVTGEAREVHQRGARLRLPHEHLLQP